MVVEATTRRVFKVFSVLLDYPRADLLGAVEEARTLVAGSPDVSDHLARIKNFVAGASLGRLQELYSATFDLSASCSPYLGYHLFGETYKRSLFLLKLRELYRGHGFREDASEMPDHLAVVLRFLASCDDDQLIRETVEEGLLPALSKMSQKNDSDQPGRESDHHQHDGMIEQLEPVAAGRQQYHSLLDALEYALEVHFAPVALKAEGA